MDRQLDLVIVGAGMVGSALAASLQHSGLRIILLEAGPLAPRDFSPDTPFEPRVSALSLASQSLLETLGAWPRMAARRISPYRKMTVWDGLGTGSIHFNADSLYAETLGHIAENRVVQDSLLECLDPQFITLLGECRLQELHRTDTGWRLLLDNGNTIDTRLVVAADGARSQIRRLAAMPTREWDYLHHAIVTSVRCAQPHDETARQRFTPDGPLAFLPLRRGEDQHWCSIVWSNQPDTTQYLMALNDRDFCIALERAFESRLGTVEQTDPRLSIPLRQRHAKHYVQQGMALIGDAAHVIHPLAGQGVNLGFLDVIALSDVLQQAHIQGEDIASLNVLRRYQRRRMPENLAMMSAMEGLERLFQSDLLPLRWLRNIGLSLVDGLPDVKALLIRRALGLENNLPNLVVN